jgi:hypothetical protein
MVTEAQNLQSLLYTSTLSVCGVPAQRSNTCLQISGISAHLPGLWLYTQAPTIRSRGPSGGIKGTAEALGKVTDPPAGIQMVEEVDTIGVHRGALAPYRIKQMSQPVLFLTTRLGLCAFALKESMAKHTISRENNFFILLVFDVFYWCLLFFTGVRLFLIVGQQYGSRIAHSSAGPHTIM